jgi:cyclic beta-1,2-glucan synthetase
MYRAGLESILGFKLNGNKLSIEPCIPRWWHEYEITYRRGGSTYHIVIQNPLAVSRGVASVELDGQLQADGEIPLVDDGKTHRVNVVLGEPQPKTETPASEVDREKAHIA